MELDPNGVPMYDIKEGVAWDNIPFTPALEELARNTRSVCFGSLAQRSVVSRETINRFLDTMPDGEGQCKIFDVNLRQGFYTKEILCNSMKKCNILKINDADQKDEDGQTNGTISADATVKYENSKNATTPTGVIMNVAPYALMVVIAVAGVAVFMRKRVED